MKKLYNYMAEYKITATTNDISQPFGLSQGTNFAEIQTIDLNGCYASFPSFSGHSKLTKVEDGYITNTNGDYMFNGCPSLTTFTSNLNSLTNGYYMFWSCPDLTSFTSDMPNLITGQGMFLNCSSLQSFESDLSSLENGNLMFNECTSLQSVKIKCRNANKSLMTKTSLKIRNEATLQVSTDGGTTWETIND